jgi:hypothetical protein
LHFLPLTLPEFSVLIIELNFTENTVLIVRTVTIASIPMKTHELLTSPDKWGKDSPAEDSQGNKLQAHDPPERKMVRTRCDPENLPFHTMGRSNEQRTAGT